MICGWRLLKERAGKAQNHLLKLVVSDSIFIEVNKGVAKLLEIVVHEIRGNCPVYKVGDKFDISTNPYILCLRVRKGW